MTVNLAPPEVFEAVRGLAIGTGCAGIKRRDRDDVVVFSLPPGAAVAALFTQSAFAAAPVQVARRHLHATSPRALVINSGNANAATGELGIADALECCRAVAEAIGVRADEVLPFSTGVIGQRLPLPALIETVAAIEPDQARERWLEAARAIMTTDTVPKLCSRTVEIDGEIVNVTGIAKGAGMIRPDMATMLAFIAMDAAVPREALDGMLACVNRASFSRITIDGDTSTNDSLVLLATGAGPGPVSGPDDRRYRLLEDAATDVALELAQAVVRDGEGATKFATIRVDGGASEDECLAVAFTIAESPLVKTALFAGDPNWGRFCMAIGRAGVPDLDPGRVALWLDDVAVAEGGMIAPSYTEALGAAVMAQNEFTVRVHLGRGEASATVWTSDLSYEYVRINAEYRT